MDPRYKGTVVEKITPLIKKDAVTTLKRHGVAPEQYALWLYRRAVLGIGLEVALVLALSVTILAALIVTLINRDGVALDGQTMVMIVSIAGVFALILSLTAWSMRHSSGVVTQHLASERFAHKTTVGFITHLPYATLLAIKTFEPDLTHFQTHRTVFRKPPSLTIVQQRRIALLRPWQTLAGWTALGTFALLFFVGEHGLNVVSALVVTTVGVWLMLRSLQLAIAKQIVDHKSGLVTFGTPAKLLSVFLIAFSIAIVVIGVGGILMTV